MATITAMDYGILLYLPAVLAIALAASAGVDRKLGRLETRLARMERKLDAVLEHHGVALADPALEEVKGFLRQGKKLHAVKAYRKGTGAGLKEATEAVERLAGQR
jgi:ribosomal protein L7/L12